MGKFLVQGGGSLLTQGGGHLLVQGGSSPSPAIVASWTGGYAISSGFYFPYPAARPVQVSITNTPGDWVFALVAWRPSEPGVSMCLADDAHNWWEPVGAPSADSGVAGAVRTALWAAPAAKVANSVTGVTVVQAAPTGPVLSACVYIADVANLLPWYQVAAIGTNEANAATSLALSAGSLGGAVLFCGLAHDDSSVTVTGPGGGWGNLATVTATNGVDHTADLELTAAWLSTIGSLTVTGAASASASTDLAGVIAGVVISATQPAQPNPSWPVMITEAAIGAGVQTPPSQLTWTTLGGRSLAMTSRQGKSYSLGQLQAGQGTITLDDPDGALIPPGTGAYAGIDSGTPLRRRVIWPASSTPHNVTFNGYIRRLPWTLDGQLLRGKLQAEITDIWGYGAGPLNAMGIEECLIDAPHSLWPMTDPAGSVSASNVVPNGVALNLAVSKYGSAGATVTWGANSGVLTGMSSAKVTASGASGGGSGMFQQALAGTSLSSNGFGYALTATDQAFPPVSGGVTVEYWAQVILGGAVGFSVAAASPATFGTNGSLAAGQAVIPSTAVGFTFPTGITAGTIYYVIGTGGTNFQLSTSPTGGGLNITAGGQGFFTPVLIWNPVILAARHLGAPVAGLEVNKTTGALMLRYRPANAVTDTSVTVDNTQDYRNMGNLRHFSLSFTTTTWRVLVDAGKTVTATGTFSSPLPANWTVASFSGVMDRTSQGLNYPGYGSLAGVYPGISPQIRVINRYWAQFAGMRGEAACDRVERLLEYAGLAGRRWLGQQVVTLEGDLLASGQDTGGQAAVSSISNVAQSTLPALVYVAPTGDVVYRSKLYTYNEPVRWTLGDNTAGGEIPFLPAQMATDYDPTRVTADVQLTALDTQSITTPAGVMSTTNMAAVAAAAEGQYGGTPYQNTGYLTFDWSSAYNAGGSLQDLANWVQAVYAKPQNRVQAVTVDAARHPSAFPFWAGVSVGDMVQVNVRLPTAATSPLISLIARVTQTDRSSQFSQEGTSATVTCTLDFAPEYNALTADDSVRGLLNGTNVLAW
jgi:hypothetical protein